MLYNFTTKNNDDDNLNKVQYVNLVNNLTETSFPRYAFDALPEPLKINYVSLAHFQVPTGAFEIQMNKERGGEDSNDDNQSTIRQICKNTIQAVTETIRTTPTREPSTIATGRTQFMASCSTSNNGGGGGGGGGVSQECYPDQGNATLSEALEQFLEFEIAPLFSIHYNSVSDNNNNNNEEENTRRILQIEEEDEEKRGKGLVYLKSEEVVLNEMKDILCPRHPGDTGDVDTTICYMVKGTFPVFVLGNDKDNKYAQDITVQAEMLVLNGIKAGMLGTVLDVVAPNSPWTIYNDIHHILSTSPSSEPTFRPSSLVPTTMTTPTSSAPTSFSPANVIASSSVFVVPTEQSTSPPSMPFQLSQQENKNDNQKESSSSSSSSWWNQLKDIASSELGIATGAAFFILIALQCCREFITSKMMKCFTDCWNRYRGGAAGGGGGSTTSCHDDVGDEKNDESCRSPPPAPTDVDEDDKESNDKASEKYTSSSK